jgi:hypothetical protein
MQFFSLPLKAAVKFGLDASVDEREILLYA